MIPVAVWKDGGGEDMWRLAGVSRLRLVYCTINMCVFSVRTSTCKQTGASERSRVRAEIVYITVSELFLVVRHVNVLGLPWNRAGSYI